MAEVAAPTSLNYSNQLPLGIENKSHRRLFFPSTGDKYESDGANICRIDINYDGMLDTSQSYLLMKIKNNATGQNIALDMGQPVISRLKIESGGVVLEDIQNYNQLIGGILVPSQGGKGTLHHEGFNLGLSNFIANEQGIKDSSVSGVLQRGALAGGAQTESNGSGVIANNNEYTICYKLVSGLLDNDKYLPLVLMNAGLTIQIEFATGIEAAVAATDVPSKYSISGIRYVAHLIDLERNFYDRMRAVQQASGGNLTIAGTSFRSFTANIDAVATENTLNIPARVRSIKSVFWKFSIAPSNRAFNISNGGHAHLQSYQLKIGATNYPPTAINVNPVTNKVEPYLELQKAFGKLGSTIHSDMLGSGSYLIAETASTNSVGGQKVQLAPFGIDLEAFRHQIENGIDTSSRALPMSLNLTHSQAPTAATAHIFVMFDAMFYILMDGSVSVSS